MLDKISQLEDQKFYAELTLRSKEQQSIKKESVQCLLS